MSEKFIIVVTPPFHANVGSGNIGIIARHFIYFHYFLLQKRKYVEDERSHPEEDHTIAELEEEYKKSLLDAARKKGRSASNIIDGGRK